jgi:hypothetical protein
MFQPAGCATKRKGDSCEAHVLTTLVDASLIVLAPWGDNARYDLVVDLGCRFLRVQCKVGRLVNGCVVFDGYSTGRRGKRIRYLPGEIDYFGVWCEATGAVYLVPLQEATSPMPYLRVDEPRPGSTGAPDSRNPLGRSLRCAPGDRVLAAHWWPLRTDLDAAGADEHGQVARAADPHGNSETPSRSDMIPRPCVASRRCLGCSYWRAVARRFSRPRRPRRRALCRPIC